MSYRDDLAAAHARIQSLEAELSHVLDELAALRAEVATLRDDAAIGREARAARDIDARKEAERIRKREEKEHQQYLRDKMKREQREVEESLKLLEYSLTARDDEDKR